MRRRDFLILASLLITGCATKPSSPPAVAAMQFTQAERDAIARYYSPAKGRSPDRKPPPQRARVGDLLDSGQRPNKLPIELARHLPDLPASFTRLTLGADVVLVNRDSHLILDVIPQVAY